MNPTKSHRFSLLALVLGAFAFGVVEDDGGGAGAGEQQGESDGNATLEPFDGLHPDDQIARLHAATRSLALSLANTADTTEAAALLA